MAVGILLVGRLLDPAQAQSVSITGEADVSALVDRLDDQQQQIDELRTRVDALADPTGTTPEVAPVPSDPDPLPTVNRRIGIGMNLDFVGRNGGRHPDRPDTPGYDDL
ncbi:MAG: hypothetical protein D6688_10400, partial [Alphaproteobacteria bacterium]